MGCAGGLLEEDDSLLDVDVVGVGVGAGVGAGAEALEDSDSDVVALLRGAWAASDWVGAGARRLPPAETGWAFGWARASRAVAEAIAVRTAPSIGGPPVSWPGISAFTDAAWTAPDASLWRAAPPPAWDVRPIAKKQMKTTAIAATSAGQLPSIIGLGPPMWMRSQS